MNRGVGHGTIAVNSDGKSVYRGTLPDIEIGEEVAILKKSDLELILKIEIGALIVSRREMSIELYDCEIFENPLLSNELIYMDPNKQFWKLFLDRHTYGLNHKDELWIRYVSVDQMSKEECELQETDK